MTMHELELAPLVVSIEKDGKPHRSVLIPDPRAEFIRLYNEEREKLGYKAVPGPTAGRSFPAGDCQKQKGAR